MLPMIARSVIRLGQPRAATSLRLRWSNWRDWLLLPR